MSSEPSEHVVLRFTNNTVSFARDNYPPESICEQSDGSLFVTITDPQEDQISNLVLTAAGAVQVISPLRLTKIIIAKAQQVIKANTPAKTPLRKIVKQGSYKDLLTYKKSQIIYDATVLFTRRFLQNRIDRTVDQMIQAARSGKQNIIEGAKASGVSSGTELNLTGIARGSLEELLEDYYDYLHVNKLSIWELDDKATIAIRELGRRKDESFETYREYFEKRSAGTFANIMICLIHQCNYLLDRQIDKLESSFIENGGIRERMFKARMNEKNKRKEG